ncbi:hypothetical protein P691DRAFT_778022 [Macrolepiota fuliginosa MF-IS2]|uniref:Uncharacterized protein n=1 Tax=Macrolepiota fuliginosa MF-IS2 TaxID=1400762 RepID=A0A9P6C0W0_9AGAR|nr:hypothetical protein P691DRAFT_778022 [Macrolepiota fuliginosa MF-IS2]
MVSFRLSASHSELDKLACRIPVSPHFFSTTILGLLPGHTETLPPPVAALYAQISLAKRQIFILEAENAFLRGNRDDLRLTVKFLLTEIAILHAALEYANDDEVASRLARADKERISHLERRLADYHRFVRILAEGQLCDPKVIGDAQTGLEQGRSPDRALIEAIQSAARDKDSPWSNILLSLFDHFQDPRPNAAILNLNLKTRKDLNDMERLACFWKAQAVSQSPDRTIFSGALEVVNRNAALDPHSGLATSNTSDHSWIQGSPDSCSSSVTSLPLIVYVSPEYPEHKRTPAPDVRSSCSDGLKAPIPPTRSKCYTKHMRRITFRGSTNTETQASAKRHGFVMPRIETDPRKHASAPVKVHLFADSPHVDKEDDPFKPSEFPSFCEPYLSAGTHSTPDTTHRISSATTQVLQSVERLCATFSSGSLGSLEMSILSESSRNTVPNPSIGSPCSVDNSTIVEESTLIQSSVSMMLGRVYDLSTETAYQAKPDSDTGFPIDHGIKQSIPLNSSPGDATVLLDTTMTTPILPRKYNISSTDHQNRVATQPTKKERESTLTPVKPRARIYSPPANPLPQRTALTTEGATHSKSLANKSMPLTSATTPPTIHSKTLGGTNNVRDLTTSDSASQVSCPPTMLLVTVPVASVGQGCAPSLDPTPSLAPIKAVVPISHLKVTKNHMPSHNLRASLERQLEPSTIAITASQSHSRTNIAGVPQYNETRQMSTSTSYEKVLIPNPRGRLRVINNNPGPTPRKVTRPPLPCVRGKRSNTHHSEAKPPNPTGVEEVRRQIRAESRGRTSRTNPTGLRPGMKGCVGRNSPIEMPHVKEGAVKLESRSRDKRM